MKNWFKRLLCKHLRTGKLYLFLDANMWWVYRGGSNCPKCSKRLFDMYPAPFRPGHWTPTKEYKPYVDSYNDFRQGFWWL